MSNKERKANIIKALKGDLLFYKRKCIKPNIIYQADLRQLRLQAMFLPSEVYAMPKDAIPELLIRRMVHQFEDSIAQLPIETEFDEQRNVYKARLDLWVKPISNYPRVDKED